MAIEKKLICFARLEEFQRQLAAGNIKDYSIVLIQDAKKIYNRGTYYDCSGITQEQGDERYLRKITEEGMTVGVIDRIQSPNADMIYSFIGSGNGNEDGIILTSDATKTINGQSILGTGNITIEGGAKVYELDLTGRGNLEGYITEEEWNIIKTSDRIKIITDIFSTEIVQIYSSFLGLIGDVAVFGPSVSIQGGGITNYMFTGANTTEGSPYSYHIIEVHIPTKTSQLENDSNFVSSDGLKTINGESIVGSGDIVIEGGETLTESDIAAMGFTKNTGTYSKPSGGIPKTDLASAVQTSLGKADTALQSVPSGYATETYVNNAIASAITTTLNTAV